MIEVPVNISRSEISYPVRIGRGILGSVDFRAYGRDKAAIIYDPFFRDSPHLTGLEDTLRRQKFEVLSLPLVSQDTLASNPGINLEFFKTIHTAYKLFVEIGRAKHDRDSPIIAVGGGVTGDIAGLVASIFMRGARVVQVPTDVTAMADASIGGKTAFDVPELPNGKNLGGTTYQPGLVVADVDFLATLPEEQHRYGMAEVVKAFLIGSREWFEYVERNPSRRDEDFYLAVLPEAVRIKAGLVSADENDRGVRRRLNYGHTGGHALEEEIGYQKIAHGAAVALGMRLAARIAVELGILLPGSEERQNRLLDVMRLPKTLSQIYSGRFSIDSFIERARGDKKSTRHGLWWVVLEEIGRVHEEMVEVDEKLLRECLQPIMS